MVCRMSEKEETILAINLGNYVRFLLLLHVPKFVALLYVRARVRHLNSHFNRISQYFLEHWYGYNNYR